mmetsp:Transcript_5247/g.8116  ORF Transcript_5247/g.8116 Transcript_5247/m.8116 type:complete len:393 (-) Transcript_5247:233-1411(-)
MSKDGGLKSKRRFINGKKKHERVKNSVDDSGNHQIEIMLTTDEDANFSIDLTAEEKMKRRERKLRFTSGNGGSSEKKEDASLADAINSTLSAPRYAQAPENSNVGKKRKRSATNKHPPGRFVGTSTNLEKPFLRLTTFPKEEDVRPLNVLKDCLQRIKRNFKENEDFDWANEQLKSVRQDITVQGIKNEFVIQVYETHARIALEHGALNEFNQCQSMIHGMTTGMGTPSQEDESFGCSSSDNIILKQNKESADEFLAYRLLYALVQNASVTDALGDASRLGGPSCKHAMMVCISISHCDYHSFFRLYESAPHLGVYLMDFLLQRMRLEGYKRIIAAYRPTVSVEFLKKTLLFSDVEETRRFLKECKAKFIKEKGRAPALIDCKLSRTANLQN